MARTFESQSLTSEQLRETAELRYTLDTKEREIDQYREENTALTITIERLQEEVTRAEGNYQWLQSRLSEKGSGEGTLARQVESLTQERL